MYLDYTEYQTMGGELEPVAFGRFSRKAERFLDLMTHNRIRDETPVRECVKQCVFDLIGVFCESEAQSAPAGAVSVSNDGVSIAYGSAEAREKAVATRKKGVLIEYLAGEARNGVPLLYGGVQFDTFRQ